jgi:hypothetical protein
MSRALLACFLVATAPELLPSVADLHAGEGKPAKQTVEKTLPVRIINPRKLGTWLLPAERISLGEEYPVSPYKPSLALLPSGELVMVAFHSHDLPRRKVHEWTSLWRSTDGGHSWIAQGTLKDMIGREQCLTCTRDGTLFATSHFLSIELDNKEGYTHSYLHRSTDGGRTWQRTRLGPDGFPPKAITMNSRNIVERPDGTLLMGVAVMDHEGCRNGWLWKSRDSGRTWDRNVPEVKIEDYNGKPYENANAFFTEDFTYLTKSGKLLHWIRCGPPSPIYPLNDGRAQPNGGLANDNFDRTVLCESTDDGKSWGNYRNFGDYGVLYPRALRLRDGRLLLTYTQRGIFYPIGLRAILSYDDGETWDFQNDQIVIEGKTPWGQHSGGGFGNTVQLKDHSLVTCYTYRSADDRTHLEVVRWQLPP